MEKDFDLIMEAAHDLKTPLFTSAIAHQVYTPPTLPVTATWSTRL